MGSPPGSPHPDGVATTDGGGPRHRRNAAGVTAPRGAAATMGRGQPHWIAAPHGIAAEVAAPHGVATSDKSAAAHRIARDPKDRGVKPSLGPAQAQQIDMNNKVAGGGPRNGGAFCSERADSAIGVPAVSARATTSPPPPRTHPPSVSRIRREAVERDAWAWYRLGQVAAKGHGARSRHKRGLQTNRGEPNSSEHCKSSRDNAYQPFGANGRLLYKCALAQMLFWRRRKRTPHTAMRALSKSVDPLPKPANRVRHTCATPTSIMCGLLVIVRPSYSWECLCLRIRDEAALSCRAVVVL